MDAIDEFRGIDVDPTGCLLACFPCLFFFLSSRRVLLISLSNGTSDVVGFMQFTKCNYMQGKQNSQAINLYKTNQQDKHQYQQNMQQNPENPANSKTKPPVQTEYIQARTIQAKIQYSKQNFQQNSEQFPNSLIN